MNFSKVINCAKLYDLYEQIFDYFNLTIYDLESCIDTNLSIEKIKNKLETFSDNHFKNALNEFNEEIRRIKNYLPDELSKIEKLSDDLKFNFNTFLDKNFIDFEKVASLKNNFKISIDKISKVYS
jgi:hypothetical protein|tara:strand:+ start:104 stop:478 length:375 start_codon:yes stop_codon:yes gene_type:complete